ncbi:RNI-like protein [Guyanagaster necrorhizus]|uniref:RNI-like protein n=1 Tax=Guyanagaster necrorhizus TaxID=856835 RepID=A0A9P7VY98_9AGAR|nr:RNI-like protein [Guyanagaster necrorhizus MCA 3950]KAG7449154.1 RNI-like protein [Guyanagaster necrorhizus MCA 3950]
MSYNNVRGPTSALTEFLRDSGITATTIARRSATANRPAAGPSNTLEEADNVDANQEDGVQAARRRTRSSNRRSGYVSDELDDPASPTKKRKLSRSAEAKMKKKQGEKSKKDDKDDEDEDEDAYTALSRSMWSIAGSPSKPPVGNFDTCAKCQKQFTVSKYTVAADPGPGYLCHPCAKSSGNDPFKKPTVPKKCKPTVTKRVVNSEERLFPSLASLCIQIISRYIDDIEALGDIGTLNMEAISKAISKNRSLTSANAHLFYGPEITVLTLYDATKLTPDALSTLAHFNPNLTTLRLDFCGLLSDEVMSVWSKSLPNLVSLQLLGPFLVRPPAWINFFESHPQLECFKITQSPRFDVKCIETLITTSQKTLRALGLKEIGKISDEFLNCIKLLEGQLTYLDISEPSESCSEVAIIDMLSTVASTLTHLDLSNHTEVSDKVLQQGLQAYSNAITSLGLRNLPELTDAGVANFFNSWTSNPPLTFLDISRIHLLNKGALLAILAHSGSSLQELNINGWRDIDNEALEEIGKQARDLKKVDLGFCRGVDDFTVKSIIEGNKGGLQEVKVWGCNRVEGKWTVSGKQRHIRIYGIESH